jgi:hypothetical protein
MILTCAFLMAMMCAAGMAEEQKADKGNRPGRIEGKNAPMQEKRAMHILKQIEAKDPALAKKLLNLKKNNPKNFRDELFKATQKYKLGKGSGKGPGRDGHRERMMQWEKERNAEYIAWLKDNYPEEAVKLEKLQKGKPGIFNRHVRISRKIYGEIREMQKENPKIAENMKEQLEVLKKRTVLITSAQSLADQIKKAKGPKRDKLVKQLKETLSIRIDLIVVLHKLQYEVLEEKIRQLNKQIAEQKAQTDKFIQKKDEEIAKRMERLLREEK